MVLPRHRPVALVVALLAGLFVTLDGVGAPVPAGAAMSAANVTLTGTDREPGGAPSGYVGTGLGGGFMFFDGDLPPHLRRIAVRISSSSDPTGIPVWAARQARASAMYTGSFSFSTTTSDAATSTLRVAPGDQVTMTYLDAANDAGEVEVVRATAAWNPGSAQPDSRYVSFANANPQAPVARGAWRAVAPNATVRVYATEASTTAIATGDATGDGSFDVTLPAMASPPPEVWLTAQEGGEAESVRVRAGWAAVTGRVVLPEAGSPPVDIALIAATKVGCTGQVGCSGGGITDPSGRFLIDPSRNNWPGAGDYVLDVHQQTIDSPARSAPWKSKAYGDPPDRAFTVASATTTTDLGDTALVAPNVYGRVRAGALAVPEAQVDILSAQGDYLPGGGYTRDDGRFALHLDDGDYVVWIRPPVGCGGYRDDRKIAVQVRGGAATPSDIDADVAIGGQAVPAVAVPVASGGGAPVAVSVLGPAGDVAVTLQGASGGGSISAGCASLGDRPDLDLVAPPVELAAPGLSFNTAEVCVDYDREAVQARGIDPSQLQLFHFAPDGTATAVTTSRDLASGVVCGRTTSFSPFAVARATGGPPPSAPAPTAPNSRMRSGYRMVGETGDVYTFGDGAWLGNTPTAPVADIEHTPSSDGYWIANAAGQVFAHGDARWYGNAPGLRAGETVTSISSTSTGDGYWLFTTAGAVLPFGDALFYGDMQGTRLNGPVLDSIPTPSGRGYFMVASDGGIFTFGDARFAGSMGSVRLNAPVQSLVPDPDGAGYWLVASDGGIFSFDADFHGSMASVKLNKPITGMVGFRRGYLMVAADGGIFTFGDAAFHGSLGSSPPARPIVSVAPIL